MILFVFIVGVAKSQQTIRGKIIIDDVVVNTLVELKSINGTLIEETSTDQSGEFNFNNILKGDYILLVNEIGYTEFYKKLKIENEDLNLGKIVLKEENEISTIEILGKKTIIKNDIDRKTVFIGGDIGDASASLEDVMGVVPGVQISVDQNLILRGNEVKLYINDRLSLKPFSEIMNSIPPSSIEKIEVITNPPAKYAAEGTSGIINIILRKDIKIGFNTNIATSFYYDENPQHTTRIGGNYSKNKYNIRSSVYYSDINREEGVIQDREAITYKTAKDLSYNKFVPHIGFDYYFDDKNTLSTDFNYNGLRADVNSVIDSLSKESNINTRYTQKDDTNFNEYETKLFYQRKFDKKKHQIDFEGLFQLDDDSEKIEYFYNSDYESLRYDKEYLTRLNVDYTNPISGNTTMEFGGEALWYTLDEDFTIRNTINDLDFKRNVFGLYSVYQTNFNKINIQLGLRGEYTETSSKTSSDNFNNDYFELFPSAYIGYKLNDVNQLKINYSRRIERPSQYLYRPVREEFNNYELQGNNSLKPQLTDNIELSYDLNKKKIYFGLSFYIRMIKDEIGNNRFVDENNPDFIIYQKINMGKKNEYGTEVSLNYSPFNWWDFNSSANLYYYKRQGFINNVYSEVKDNRFDLQVYNIFNVLKKFKLAIEGRYNSSYDDFFGKNGSRSRINLSVVKKFMENKIKLNIRYNDLFNNSIPAYKQAIPVVSIDKPFYENQQFVVSVKYNFSSGKDVKRIKKRRRRNNTTEGVGK